MSLKIPTLHLQEEEMFRPNMFFLLLLPPIIFESGYSLHKVRLRHTLVFLVWMASHVCKACSFKAGLLIWQRRLCVNILGGVVEAALCCLRGANVVSSSAAY